MSKISQWVMSHKLAKLLAVGFGVLTLVMAISLTPAAPAFAAPQSVPMAARLCNASGTIWLNGVYGQQHSWLHRVNLPSSKYGKLYKAYLRGTDITYFAMRVPAGQSNTYIDFWVSSQLGNTIYPNKRVNTTVTYFC